MSDSQGTSAPIIFCVMIVDLPALLQNVEIDDQPMIFIPLFELLKSSASVVQRSAMLPQIVPSNCLQPCGSTEKRSKSLECCFKGSFHWRTKDILDLIHVGKGIDTLTYCTALIDAMLCEARVSRIHSLGRRIGQNVMQGLAEISFYRLDLGRREEVPGHDG